MSRRRRQGSAVQPSADASRRERFEALFGLVYEPLQVYARRRTDTATADDVVADALLVLWRRLDEIPDEQALPWCYGVARRCLANHRRSDQRRDALVDRLLAEPGAVGVPASDGDRDRDLVAAMAALSADDREIVRLWAWEGLPPREIAVVLGISANAAAIRVHRAKQRIAAASAAETRKNEGRDGHTSVGHAKEAP
jgi:RNA polymerase sigma-70 factor, ECF subfamily